MTSSIWDIQSRAGFNGLHSRPAGCIFCIDGTLYPGAPAPPFPARNDGQGFWSGFSSGVAGGLMNVQDGLWDSVCIGYPAAITPMWASVQIGRAYTVSSIKWYADTYHQNNGTYAGLALVLSGYSQGAEVVDQVWTEDFLAETGVLHYLLPYVLRIYNFGDPLRAPGIANGNLLMGQPLPKHLDGVVTGGIGGPLDLTAAQTPDFFYSFANDGDLYACCPTGPDPKKHEASAGKVGTGIFSVISHATFFNVIAIAKDLFHPIGTVEEIYNGLKFASEGTQAPHWLYFDACVAAVSDMVTLGNQLVHD